MLKVPGRVIVKVGFEEHPDSPLLELDVLEAYQKATELWNKSPDDWLLSWGEWIRSLAPVTDLLYADVDLLWAQVKTLHDALHDEACKRAVQEAIVILSANHPRPCLVESLN